MVAIFVLCGSAAAAPAAWSPVVNGLRVQIELNTPKSGARSVDCTLRFQNAGKTDLRLYFLRNPIFRYHSQLTLLDGQGGLLSHPEPARPHGLVVTEDEFSLLKPGESLSFSQSVGADAPLLGGQTVTVIWGYENRVRRWPGGAKTLDGVTQPLFGGKDIPFIWLGAIETKGSAIVR